MPRWPDTEKTPLALLRTQAGLSRNEAAVKLSIGFATLGRYETGIGDISVSLAEKMANLYNVPFDNIRAAIADTAKEGSA
jgi:transcriptional regulator with XRE-family HTH domain